MEDAGRSRGAAPGSAGEAAPLPSLALGVNALSGCAKLSRGGAQAGHCAKRATSGGALQHKPETPRVFTSLDDYFHPESVSTMVP